MARPVSALLGLVVALGAPAPASAAAAATASDFVLVGHDPLFARGMNAAPAFYDHYVYVGNRTDGQPHHPHPGVLVVDVADPSDPQVVGEIGPPHEGNVRETSRELRVWPEERLLIVMNFGCSSLIHACAAGETEGSNIKFYDLAADPEDPPLVATYVPSRTPHEMFLWDDPKREGRALLYLSTPTSRTDRPNLIVTDISRARAGEFPEVATWIGTDLFSQSDRQQYDVRLHSMGVSADGSRTYLAFLGAGFLVLDTSDLAAALPEPEIRTVTPVERRASWGNPGAHSAVKIPSRDVALVTDEVYGDALDPITGDNHGCPWGWVRMIDITDESTPRVMGEYRVEQNHPEYCQTADGQDPSNTYATSYSAHNPTVLRRLALVTWHSAGLQAFSLTDPAQPVQTGAFSPAPLPTVATEDPALSAGRNKVVMWSYPIIVDGLIYVVDIRNGLYVLRYTGPGADEVARTSFLEGNSNLGDAPALEAQCRRGKRSAYHAVGTSAPDHVIGTAGSDVICGLRGSDRLLGRRGKDLVLAAGGSDRANGGRGRDRVVGGRGDDVLRGSGGADRLRGGPGFDACIGGPGRDRFAGCERVVR